MFRFPRRNYAWISLNEFLKLIHSQERWAMVDESEVEEHL